MENPEYILTDSQINTLMQQMILQYPDDAITGPLTECEALAVFAAEPLSLPNLLKEKKMLQQLKGGLSNSLKWLLGCIGLAAVIGAVFQFNPGSTQPKPGMSPQTLAVLPPTQPGQAAMAATDTFAAIPHQTAVNNTPGLPQTEPTQAPALQTNPAQPEPVTPGENLIPEQLALSAAGNSPFTATHMKAEVPCGVAIDTSFAGVTRLEVTTHYCDVQLSTLPGDKVLFSGKMEMKSKGVITHKPDYAIFYEQQGPLLKVWIENRNKHQSSLMIGSLNISGMLNFHVPAKLDVVIKNSSGNITATGLQGTICQLSTNYGNIHATDIGSDICVQSTSGQVQLDNIRGNVSASSSYGNQQFLAVQGQLKTQCASGNVQASHIKGNIDIHAAYGNVELSETKGDFIIKSGSGKVSIADAEGRSGKITASYGHVTANRVQADLNIKSQSGNISLAHVKGQMIMVASYGHITLNDCKGRIEADLSSGNMTGSNVELKESFDVSSAYGNVQMQLLNNFSDLSFNLHTSYGNIKVDKNGKQYTAKNGTVQAGEGGIHVKCATTSGSQVFQ